MSDTEKQNKDEPEKETLPAQEESGVLKQRFKFRWWIAAIILVGALLIQIFYWFKTDGDTSALVISAYFIWLSTALLLVIWWIIASGLNWKVKILGLFILGISIGVFKVAFRFEGFSGSFIPSFSFRFVSSGEEKAIEYWDRNGDPSIAPEIEKLEVTEEDWPQFRGHHRDGIVTTSNFRTNWDEKPPKQIWKHPVGPSWSSFVRIGPFLYTQEQRQELECVVCYLAETGEEVWVHSDRTRHETPLGGVGPRSTPVFYQGALYSLGATGIVNCLDAIKGNVLWTRNTLEDANARNITWGLSGAPLVYQGSLLINPGGNDDRSIIAYDLISGEIKWANGNRRTGYASLTVMQVGESEQLLYYGNTGLFGLASDNGEELWQFPWQNDQKINCAEPIPLDGNTVLISSGYGLGSALLQLTREEGNWKVSQTKWETNKRFKLKFNAAVRVDKYVYGLNEAILTCLDTETGKFRWRKRGGYGYGQILLVNDNILILTESGDVALVEVRPDKPVEFARFNAIEGKTWNHPILSGGKLYVRNAEEAACFDVSQTDKSVVQSGSN